MAVTGLTITSVKQPGRRSSLGKISAEKSSSDMWLMFLSEKKECFLGGAKKNLFPMFGKRNKNFYGIRPNAIWQRMPTRWWLSKLINPRCLIRINQQLMHKISLYW